MERTKKILPRLLITLVAFAALSFGASEALAANAALTCPNNPPEQLGDCISPESCQLRCFQQVGADLDSQGTCSNGCCTCRL